MDWSALLGHLYLGNLAQDAVRLRGSESVPFRVIIDETTDVDDLAPGVIHTHRIRGWAMVSTDIIKGDIIRIGSVYYEVVSDPVENGAGELGFDLRRV